MQIEFAHGSHSSAGLRVRPITVRSAVQARVGPRRGGSAPLPTTPAALRGGMRQPDESRVPWAPPMCPSRPPPAQRGRRRALQQCHVFLSLVCQATYCPSRRACIGRESSLGAPMEKMYSTARPQITSVCWASPDRLSGEQQDATRRSFLSSAGESVRLSASWSRARAPQRAIHERRWLCASGIALEQGLRGDIHNSRRRGRSGV